MAERPATEWLYDDLGRMKFLGIHDFTAARFGENVEVVLAYTEQDGEPLGDKRVQIMMSAELARALLIGLQTALGRASDQE